MTNNEQVIHQFYTAFQQKNFAAMQDLYAENAVFSDPVFQNLNGKEVRAMWEMLIKRGKDLQLTFSNIESNGQEVTANWTATYTFSATGKKVVNLIRAHFLLENGKIVQHTDRFDFWKWSRQALGFTGWLLGWTPFLKNKVRKTARRGLAEFMKRG